jgi:tripartite ATP-independent transporter DctP family solute receptor
MFNSNAEVYKAVDSEIGDELNERFVEEAGIRILGYWMNLPRQTTNNVRPVVKAADFNGLKLRVPETKAVMETIRALGGNPTPMPFGELYTALSQGTIDGQENPPSVIYASKLYEVQKYLSLTGHVYTPTVVMIAEDFYQGLPEDLRKIILEEALAARERGRVAAEKIDTDLLVELRKLMTVNEVDTTGFRELVQPVYDGVIKEVGPEAEAYIKRLEAVNKK